MSDEAHDTNLIQSKSSPLSGARKAVVLGGSDTARTALRHLLLGERLAVRDIQLPHEFFRELHSFSPCLVVACAPFDGVEMCPVIRRIRELFGNSLPIMVIGPDDNPIEHVAALEAGADDYVAAGLPGDVLVARVRSLTRRYGEPNEARNRVRAGGFVLDFTEQSTKIGGRNVSLTPKEFDLFWVFASRVGRLISKRELLTCVWGQNCELDTHTLSQHVHALRRKLRLSEHGFQITALYGAGYRFESLGGTHQLPAMTAPTYEARLSSDPVVPPLDLGERGHE